MSDLRVGIATVEITPRVGLPLMGNFREDYAARGVDDPLHAKAMVLADGQGNKAAVLALDLCMVDRVNVRTIRQAIGSGCDVPPENVLVHAIHTHGRPDPEATPMDPHIGTYRQDIDAMLEKASSAVVLANKDLAAARLSVGHSQEDRLSFNRRLRRKDGSTQMNWESLLPGFDVEAIEGAWGPIDPELTCLVVEREGRPTAAVVNFGLHPAVLAGDNWLYSADYPGYLAEALEKIEGDRFTTIFFNWPRSFSRLSFTFPEPITPFSASCRR